MVCLSRPSSASSSNRTGNTKWNVIGPAGREHVGCMSDVKQSSQTLKLFTVRALYLLAELLKQGYVW